MPKTNITTNYETNKKWRKKHPSAWKKSQARYYKKSESTAHNSCQRWTIHSIKLIMHKEGKTDSEIAILIGRSVKAIQIMRVRLKVKLVTKNRAHAYNPS